MAQLFFKLRLVPEEEANDVRRLLDENRIDWFETSAGRWGISFPAIWLREQSDTERAESLLAEYQSARKSKMQAEQRVLAEQGEQETVFSRFCRYPVRSLATLGVILVIAYFSIRPFFQILS